MLSGKTVKMTVSIIKKWKTHVYKTEEGTNNCKFRQNHHPLYNHQDIDGRFDKHGRLKK